jgi:RNA polymerase sigma-70 factor (ECF subfamily)
VEWESDIELMLAFKRGDKSCFEKILDKYEKPLINFIARFIGDRFEAEDLAQEVFLRIYHAAKNYKPKAKFSTWLYRIATNICIDYQRKKKMRIANEISNSPNESVNELIEKKRINETIKSSLLSLPPRQRIALTLKVYQNKSYHEIAKILCCSIPAVESLLFRARQSLKQTLLKRVSL